MGQAEAVEDEMALVKGFLAQSQKMGVTPSASVTSPVGGEEEQAKDMCLLCEREFVVAGKVRTIALGPLHMAQFIHHMPCCVPR
jgi:hypothetical protein